MKKADKKQINMPIAQSGGILYSSVIVCAFFCSVFYTLIKNKLGFDNVIIDYVVGPIAILIAILVTSLRFKSCPFKPLMPIKFRLYPSLATILIFLGLTFGLSNLNGYFASWLQSLGVTITEPPVPELNAKNLVLIILTACLLPAIFEEFAFRGIIVNSLKNTGTVFAVIMGGLIFALFHMSPVQTLYQFACGAIYTLIIIYGGNFVLTFIIHFLNNLFVILNHYYFGIETTVLTTVLGLVALGGGIALLILKGKKEEPDKSIVKGERKAFVISSIIGFAIALIVWVQGLFL